LRELSLHILDIAENSLAAGATKVEVAVVEDTKRDQLSITIRDNGKGMSDDQVKRVLDPFVTSRSTRKVGLGLPLLKSAAEACDGNLTIESKPGKGTITKVCFQLSHIDRMPLGDLAETWLTLLLGSPEINWVLRYQVNEKKFFLDDSTIKQEIDDVSITEPRIIKIIRQMVRNGVEAVRQNNKEK